MSLNAVPGDPEADSYLTVVAADILMSGYFQFSKWQDLEDDEKETLLKAASRIIGQYKSMPPKQSPDQALVFPTVKDPSLTIVERVINAVLEVIDYRLENKLVTLKQQQAEGVTSASALGQSKSFNVDPSGLPAGARRELDLLEVSYQEVGFGNSCCCVGRCCCV